MVTDGGRITTSGSSRASQLLLESLRAPTCRQSQDAVMCRFAEPAGGQAEISTNIPDVPESAGYPVMQATCMHHALKHFIPAPKHLYSNPPLYTTMMMTPKLQIPIPLSQHHNTKKHPTVPLYPFPHSPFPCSETLWIMLLVITRWRRGISYPSHTEEPMARFPFTAPSSNYPPATHPTTALCFRAAPTPHVGAPALLASSPGYESACQGHLSPSAYARQAHVLYGHHNFIVSIASLALSSPRLDLPESRPRGMRPSCGLPSESASPRSEQLGAIGRWAGNRQYKYTSVEQN
jgi:hypothetical protein